MSRFRRSLGVERQQQDGRGRRAWPCSRGCQRRARSRLGVNSAFLLPIVLPAPGAGRGDPAPPALRHRRRHQPHAGLRRADGDARRRIPRARAADRSGGGAIKRRGRRLHARSGRAVPPARAAQATPSTGASTATATTPRERSRPSARGCATRSTSRRSAPSCAPRSSTRCSPPIFPYGFHPRGGRRDEDRAHADHRPTGRGGVGLPDGRAQRPRVDGARRRGRPRRRPAHGAGPRDRRDGQVPRQAAAGDHEGDRARAEAAVRDRADRQPGPGPRQLRARAGGRRHAPDGDARDRRARVLQARRARVRPDGAPDFAGNFETLKDLLEARNDFRTDAP